jgi:uncharacterized protein (TIGR03437 family)
MVPLRYHALAVTLFISTLLAQKPAIQPDGVQNAASFASQNPPVVAPQMIVTLRGQNLAVSPMAASTATLPTSLNGTTVTFNGIAAPLFYVSPTQINVQAPSGISVNASASIVVTTAVGASDPTSVLVVGDLYGILTQDVSGCGQGVVLNVHPDGSTSLNTPQNSFDPARDTALTLYMTGMGAFRDRKDGVPWTYSPADNLAVTENIPAFLGVPGLQKSTLLQSIYAGPAPELVGTDQVNLVNPGYAPYPEGCAVPLYLIYSVYTSSQLVNISIHSGGGACSDPAPDTLGLVTWERNTTSDAGASASTEGVQIAFRKGNGLLFPKAATFLGIACCSAAVQPLTCSASLPSTLGAGSLTVGGISGPPLTLAPQTAGTGIVYQTSFPPGTLQGGTYQVAATGDSAVGAFTASATIPPPITITTDLSPGKTLHLPMALTWTGGDARSVLNVQFRVGAYQLAQWVDASLGTLNLPADVIQPPLGVSPVPNGAVEIIVIQQPAASPPQFSAPGLSLGGAQTWNYVWDFRGLVH